MASRLQQICEGGGLVQKGIHCLALCGCDILTRYRYARKNVQPGDLYVLFRPDQVQSALDCGRLHLMYGRIGESPTNLMIASNDIYEALLGYGVDASWCHGPFLDSLYVPLEPADRRWLRFVLGGGIDAKACLSCFLHAWHREIFRRKVARKRIARAIVDHGSRPGGVLYRRAKARFDELKTSRLYA